MLFPPHPAADHDTAALQARAQRRRLLHTQRVTAARLPWPIAQRLGAWQPTSPLAGRLLLHLIVTALVPLAAVLSGARWAGGPQQPTAQPPQAPPSELVVVPLGPIALDDSSSDETMVPDSAFAAIDALVPSGVTADLLAVRPVAARIASERSYVRGGPGTDYDVVATVPAGTALQLVAQHEDWYQAQRADGQLVWVAAELVDRDVFAAEFLPAPLSIPAPPPPKVGRVVEEGLNLRDGPGTAYVGMVKLPAGAELQLLARYQDWFQVETAEGQTGWVTGEYLRMSNGVIERVEVVAEVPDPNPALVGHVRSAEVNLRGGPGTAYERIGSLGADVQLDLLARHKDWFRVRTPRGTEGWVSNELVSVSQFVARRVPAARNVPPLPQATQRARAEGGLRGPVQFAPASATTGPAAFALQFVGARYVWGGASPQTGFDCSGFTKYVYAQFGVSLPHGSAAQYSTRYGVSISNPGELAPGDIVFFVNTYRRGISHVGIYVGGGNVVQALTPSRGVGIASLNERYWSTRYYGAIRPNP